MGYFSIQVTNQVPDYLAIDSLSALGKELGEPLYLNNVNYTTTCKVMAEKIYSELLNKKNSDITRRIESLKKAKNNYETNPKLKNLASTPKILLEISEKLKLLKPLKKLGKKVNIKEVEFRSSKSVEVKDTDTMLDIFTKLFGYIEDGKLVFDGAIKEAMKKSWLQQKSNQYRDLVFKIELN